MLKEKRFEIKINRIFLMLGVSHKIRFRLIWNPFSRKNFSSQNIIIHVLLMQYSLGISYNQFLHLNKIQKNMFFQYLISQTEPLQWCFPYSMPFFCQNSKNCHQVQQLKNVSEESKQTDSLPSDTQILKNQEEKELKICKSEKNQPNRKKNIKEKSEQNQEYNPKSSTHINKPRGKQNVLRNILPNIMHQACTFAQKKIRSHKYVQGLLKNGNVQEATVNRYYLYHTLIKEKNNNYLNEEAFKYFKIFHEPRCELFSAKEQEEYLRISRILIKRFLEQQLRSNVLTSSRMKNQTKNGHLKVLRRVMQHLHTTYRT